MESHFTRRGYDVLIANSGKQAIDLTKANSPQIVCLKITFYPTSHSDPLAGTRAARLPQNSGMVIF